MTLIDRIRTRTGTDLPDDELQAMIAVLAAEIDSRFGAAWPITVDFGDPADPATAGLRSLHLQRPADSTQPITVIEIDPGNSAGANERELATDDFRLLHGGRTLQRLISGTHPAPRWAPMVRITYTAQGSTAARDEAVIRLIALDMQTGRGAVKSERAGDYSWTAASEAERAEARAAVFEWLAGSLGRSGFSLA